VKKIDAFDPKFHEPRAGDIVRLADVIDNSLDSAAVFEAIAILRKWVSPESREAIDAMEREITILFQVKQELRRAADSNRPKPTDNPFDFDDWTS
jgi:hypothetical protein